MNRTITDATVKRCHYETHDQLRAHLQPFVDAYNHARRLKTLRGLTPYEHVLQVWTKDPERFRLEPSHHIPALHRRSGTLDCGPRQGRAPSAISSINAVNAWSPQEVCCSRVGAFRVQ
jgi:hypothetical protein